ncbi:MAG TPA: hypothetical protein VEC92_03370 [Nitrososphaerales archaeon]|nr:hypothetical protein [Nitrososphaerales archaeon]
MGLNVQIDRSAPPGSFPFTRLFRGFEGVGAVRRIFGEKTDDVLAGLTVEVIESRGYLRINDGNGSIMVNSKYLREGEERHIYLDVIHELVHIRQHREGKELWDKNYAYVDRPTEIEAYRVAVEEARRIGLTEAEVADYLKVEWVPEEDFRRFLNTLGVTA